MASQHDVSPPAGRLPLDGVRILDFTRFQQGPMATAMLADMGADVIKIEEPGRGELSRRLWSESDGFSAFFEALDRGKRSLTLDLRQPEAKEIVYALVRRVDVVAENFRRGTMERLGFSYERLRQENPRLIYASASGFGPKGPHADRPAYDVIGLAMSGIMVASGGGPGHPPRQPFAGLADATGAMLFAYGIMLALFVRERFGIGQQIDVSLLGGQLFLQAPDVLYNLRYGHDVPHRGRRRNQPTFGDYETQRPGEYLVLASLDPRQWPTICRILGLPALAENPRYRNGHLRQKHADELEPLLEQAFRTRPREEWIALFNAEGIPCGPVYDYHEVAEDPQTRANEYIVPVRHPRYGDLRVVGVPVQLSETPGRVAGVAPEVGEHTEAVLGELGYTPERIAALRERGVI